MFLTTVLSKFALIALNILPQRMIFWKPQQQSSGIEKPKISPDVTCIVLLDPARRRVLEGVEAYFQKKVICMTDPRKVLNLIPKKGKCVLVTGKRIESSDKWDGCDVAYKAQQKNQSIKIFLVSSTMSMGLKKENQQSPFSEIVYLPTGTPSEKRTKKIISLIKKSA